MNNETLTHALEARYPGQILALSDPRHLILTSSTASRTITFEIGDDVVRILVGRIVHAEAYDDEGDIDQILAVVSAVLNGGAEELYGSTSSGLNGFIGYRITGDNVTNTRLDDDASVLHRASL